MNTLLLITLILAILASIIGGVMLIVAAFRQSLLWGLAYLFIPFASLVFLFRHWEEAKAGFLISLGGGFLLIGSLFLMPNNSPCMSAVYGAVQARSGEQEEQEFHVEKKLADNPIQKQRERILKIESELAQASTALASQYTAITAKRQALNASDPAAVIQFNEEAIAYQKLNERVKQMTQDLATAKQVLGGTSATPTP